MSFAGTFQEAVEFAEKHEGITAPKGLARKGDDSGLPMLCIRYTSRAGLIAARKKFSDLGWGEEFQIVQEHGNGFA